ncbi:TPA: hypothetical protein HA265_04140 [Candidatus Woesearchaeota archaeon]|nr:hypothetical protein [Candidatus Woesearchaeota archaeon]
MLKDFLRPKKRSALRPRKETEAKSVPAKRFNEMIDYYTRELQSRLKEIERLKTENDMLIRSSIKAASRSDQFSEQSRKLSEEVRVLQGRLRDKRS